jgi:hypothetical protein
VTTQNAHKLKVRMNNRVHENMDIFMLFVTQNIGTFHHGNASYNGNDIWVIFLAYQVHLPYRFLLRNTHLYII